MENLTIWVFGGSVVWGYGVPDDQTIPSHIAKILYQKGIAAEVINFGGFGWQSTQDTVQLTLALRDRKPPDLVIMYQGANEYGQAINNRQAGLPVRNALKARNYNRTVTMSELLHRTNLWRALKRINRPIIKHPPATSIDGLMDDIAETYISNAQIVHALADSYAFHALTVWHPIL